MQTFVTEPSLDFSTTAKMLDNKRLNKQALEAWQIMMTNLKLDPDGNYREPRGWVNHPAVRMWRGHEIYLFYYIGAMAQEWVDRGYTTTIADKALNTLTHALDKDLISTKLAPSWMRDTNLYSEIVSTHRTSLLFKNYDWYSQFNWPEDPGFKPYTYEYLWVD